MVTKSGWCLWCLAVSLLFLSGCAASGAAFRKVDTAANEGKAVVYVYRPYSIFGAAVESNVTCGSNGVHLKPGGYHAFVVEPGGTECVARSEVTEQVMVNVKAGEEGFVKATLGMGMMKGRTHLELVDKATGLEEIQDCKLQ